MLYENNITYNTLLIVFCNSTTILSLIMKVEGNSYFWNDFEILFCIAQFCPNKANVFEIG